MMLQRYLCHKMDSCYLLPTFDVAFNYCNEFMISNIQTLNRIHGANFGKNIKC